MGYYVVGWYREKLTTYPKWYDYDWGYNDDKYFNKYTPVINKEFILSQPEYKYSAIEQYEYTDTMKYLRLYGRALLSNNNCANLLNLLFLLEISTT